jgi:single-strand DNA-binding protein
MRGLNCVLLFGRIGQDPEIKQLKSGKHKCELSLATHRAVKDGDGWKDETDWHKVILWDGAAETAARLVKKGDPIAVQGELRVETWTDAAGARKSRTVVVADRMQLVKTGLKAVPDPRPQSPLSDEPDYEPLPSAEEPPAESLPF